MTTVSFKEELKELFSQLPSARIIKNDDELKLVNYTILEAIVSKMMNKAYYKGREESLDKMESMVNNIFLLK